MFYVGIAPIYGVSSHYHFFFFNSITRHQVERDPLVDLPLLFPAYICQSMPAQPLPFPAGTVGDVAMVLSFFGARRLAHWRIAHRRLAQRRIAHRRKAHRQRRFAHPHLHICQLHSYLSLSSLLCCTVAPNVRSS